MFTELEDAFTLPDLVFGQAVKEASIEGLIPLEAAHWFMGEKKQPTASYLCLIQCHCVRILLPVHRYFGV